jgi:N-methylhydantoinase A
MRRFALALDQGGSFLDLVAAPAEGPARFAKQPRTEALAEAVLRFLATEGIAPAEVASIRIATTLPANALLTGEASAVALVTTAGFTDVPDLGRQSRRDPDAADPPPPTPSWLSPRAWRFGLPGRIAANGEEVEPLDEVALARIVAALPDAPVAVCLLFAHRHPAHEQRVAAAIRAARPGAMISLSHQVDPAPREFERMLATMADAALKPLVARTLSRVATALQEAGLPQPSFGTADGRVAAPEQALAAPLPLALSGPAAGARAVARWAAEAPCAIGLDMGGTTAEVSLVRDGVALATSEVRLGEMALRCAALNVESVGIGGDRPVGSGGTLTEAARAAGWLPGEGRGATDMLAVATAQLGEAVRRIALRRAIHPDLALLVAGGGFGPLLACELAAHMGCPRVLVPPAPGLLSATGLLEAAPRLPAAWRHRDGAAFDGVAEGPLLLDDGTATIRVPSGWRARLRGDGAVLLDPVT